jgi:hypothetical protein
MTGRVPDDRYRRARPLLALVLGCAAAACVQPREVAQAVPSDCSLQVIVALDAAPDDKLLADLSRVSGARLELIRTMTSNLHLLALEAQGADSECRAAMERLRGDPRVRSVDVDARRKIQQP